MSSKAKNDLWRQVLAAIICGALLWIAWPPHRVNFIIFFALIPILWLEDRNPAADGKKSTRFLLLAYLALVVWNLLTTYWVSFATVAGAAAAILLNGLLMLIPVAFYRMIKSRAGRLAGYIALPSFWLMYEYLHFNWEAPWPWLALGNVWATSTDWVQWYEFTGTAGGTVWVWTGNILIYECLRAYRTYKLSENGSVNPALRWLAAVIVMIQGPILLSHAVKPDDAPLDSPDNIVAVQPNIDPYTEKFAGNTVALQLKKLIDLSEEAIDSNTSLVMWPETAIAEDIQEGDWDFYSSLDMIENFLRKHPQIKLLTGLTSFTKYQSEKRPTLSARQSGTPSIWYDVFNTAMLMDTGGDYAVYHKSKLVPGVEVMPYPQVFSFLGSLMADLGGTAGGRGKQDSASVFTVHEDLVIAPIICYESVFGEYVTEFVKRGASVLTIITNDGWWRNTDGYKQHMLYARLRAIETRRFIARSANTGISCFISETGDIIDPTPGWVSAVIKSHYSSNEKLTFYVKHGDYIARGAFWLGMLLFIYALYLRIRGRKFGDNWFLLQK